MKLINLAEVSGALDLNNSSIALPDCTYASHFGLCYYSGNVDKQSHYTLNPRPKYNPTAHGQSSTSPPQPH